MVKIQSHQSFEQSCICWMYFEVDHKKSKVIELIKKETAGLNSKTEIIRAFSRVKYFEENWIFKTSKVKHEKVVANW